MATSLFAFVLRRLAFLVATLFAVSVLIFALTQVLPGDVATMILGMSATPEDLATLRRQMGLERSAVIQFSTGSRPSSRATSASRPASSSR